MKQLSSYAVFSINGGDRISYTFDEIDEQTGEPISTNQKKSFYVLDAGVKEHIEAIREYIREEKLSEE